MSHGKRLDYNWNGCYKYYRDELPQWTISKFAGMGMETFTQNFTAKLPLTLNHKVQYYNYVILM